LQQQALREERIEVIPKALSPPMGTPKAFISYRRGDAPHQAMDLHRAVADRLGEEQVFFDRLDISHGDNWREIVRAQLTAGDVVLALIGPQWLDELRCRLAEPADNVLRSKLATALAMGRRVIPLLLEGGTIAAGRDLPADLAPLAGRQAAVLSRQSFQAG
jgi:TIR domain